MSIVDDDVLLDIIGEDIEVVDPEMEMLPDSKSNWPWRGAVIVAAMVVAGRVISNREALRAAALLVG